MPGPFGLSRRPTWQPSVGVQRRWKSWPRPGLFWRVLFEGLGETAKSGFSAPRGARLERTWIRPTTMEKPRPTWPQPAATWPRCASSSRRGRGKGGRPLMTRVLTALVWGSGRCRPQRQGQVGRHAGRLGCQKEPSRGSEDDPRGQGGHSKLPKPRSSFMV